MTIHDISNLPVMKKQCMTCPFRTDERGRHLDERLVAKIQMCVLTESSHICHHHKLVNRPESHLCRGARDYQLEIFYRMGLLAEPTDRCWSKTRRQ